MLNILLILFFCISNLFAQKEETIRVRGNEITKFIAKSKYKFRSFTRSKVYLKNGEIAIARLNYDYFDQAMKYIDEKGDTLSIANGKDIDFISNGLDTFFYQNQYYEWIASSATARLAVRRTFKLLDRETIGAYGTSSPAQKVESHTAILGVTKLDLDANEELVFVKKTTYYISTIKGHFVETNKKSISKLFPHKNIDDYINQNKLDLNKEKDLIDVFVYANKPG
ncbi:MAG: hypothetical protein ABI237_07885 [Ginsengibacter sp.]